MTNPSQFTDQQKEEIKSLVNEALVEFFSSKGLLAKNWILTAAVIIGAVTVIFGGLKSILGWIGFSYIK